MSSESDCMAATDIDIYQGFMVSYDEKLKLKSFTSGSFTKCLYAAMISNFEASF